MDLQPPANLNPTAMIVNYYYSNRPPPDPPDSIIFYFIKIQTVILIVKYLENFQSFAYFPIFGLYCRSSC